MLAMISTDDLRAAVIWLADYEHDDAIGAALIRVAEALMEEVRRREQAS